MATPLGLDSAPWGLGRLASPSWASVSLRGCGANKDLRRLVHLGGATDSHPGRPSYTHSRPFAQKVFDALRWKMFQQPYCLLVCRWQGFHFQPPSLGSLRQLPGQLPQSSTGWGVQI